jgi:hypothetical protein
VSATTHDSADVTVFDMKGNRLLPKVWKESLSSDVHALVANDGKLPNPRELALFKQDTLLIVLPAAPATPAIAETFAPSSRTPAQVRPTTELRPPSPTPARPNSTLPSPTPPVVVPGGEELPPSELPNS